MPISYDDRCMIEAEAMLWNVNSLLQDRDAGAFTERIAKIQKEVQALATEMRLYNDQFEEDE